MEFKLLYRVLKENQADDDDGFDTSDKIKIHEGQAINLVIGMTASGKTSMIQISAGGDETSVRTKSETQDPVLVFDQVNNKLWLDTAGMCDSSEDSKRKALLRDAILNAIKQYKFTIGRIFVCVACDQNMDLRFCHEYIELKAAFQGADSLTRIVITKVNRPKKAMEIDAEGGLKDKYASAFGCSNAQVLLHGCDQLSASVLAHAISPSFKSGIDHGDIGTVTENAELKKKIQHLNAQLERSRAAKSKHLSDNQQAEEKIKDIYMTIEAAEETLDHMLSTNNCGRNDADIKNARFTINKARDDAGENERKLRANEISANQASSFCDKTNDEVMKVKSELEGRMRRGLSLAKLAGADKIFRLFFED